MLEALGIFVTGFGAQGPDHYRCQTFLGLCALSLWFAKRIYSRVHILAAVLFAWSACSAAYCFSWPESPFGQLGAIFVTSIDSTTAQAFGMLFAVTVVLLEADKQSLINWKKVFYALCIANSISMLIRKVGVMDNRAMDATLVVCLLPLVLFGKRCLRALAVLPLAAILTSGSSTAFLGLGVCILAYFRSIRVTLISIGSVIAIGHYVLGKELFNPNGRTEIWTHSLQWWTHYKHHWSGVGLGTFEYLGPKIYPAEHPLIWLHNDWLQIVFELGIPGGVLALILFFLACKRLYSRPILFSMLLTYGFTANFQMPLRHGVTAILGALLIRLAFYRENRIPK